MSDVENDFKTIEEPINNASSEVQQIIRQVLHLEKERLYAKSSKSINDDILRLIKEVIR